MLRIRLRRVGKKGRPYYRIVVTERRNPRDGAYIDGIGHYDPMADPPAVTINAPRAVAWLRKGAQPSDPVRRILDYHGISAQTDPASADPELESDIDNALAQASDDGAAAQRADG